MPVDSLGVGEVWSDPDRPIIHFGSPVVTKRTTIIDQHGRPIE